LTPLGRAYLSRRWSSPRRESRASGRCSLDRPGTKSFTEFPLAILQDKNINPHTFFCACSTTKHCHCLTVLCGDLANSIMGIQMSKVDQQCAPRAHGKKHNHQDDVFSRSTVTTADSSSLPPSPIMDSSRGSLNQSRRRASRSFAHKRTSNLRPNLQRRNTDSVPPKQEKRTEPVKCPPRKPNSVSEYGFCTSPLEGEDSQYLMRMYESRTWKMYQRITEARKNSQYSYTSSPLDTAPNNENTSEWENLQHDYMDSSDCGHEMIFVFDFD
jgi:hypothetical protein